MQLSNPWSINLIGLQKGFSFTARISATNPYFSNKVPHSYQLPQDLPLKKCSIRKIMEKKYADALRLWNEGLVRMPFHFTK